MSRTRAAAARRPARSRQARRPSRAARKPDRSIFALGILYLSALAYVAMGIGWAGMCFTAEVDPERGSETGIMLLGVGSLVVCGGLALGAILIARGVSARKDWALNLSLGYFFLWCTSIIGIPVGALGIWSINSILEDDDEDDAPAPRPRQRVRSRR